MYGDDNIYCLQAKMICSVPTLEPIRKAQQP